jgi:glycosyltransferase involved in cell wall biosynthesis
MPVHILPFQTLRDLGHLPQLIRLLRTYRPDIVHTHIMVPGNIIWRLACLSTGTPLIQHIHARIFYGRGRIKPSVVRCFDRATARIPKRLIAVCSTTARLLQASDYPSIRVCVVHNGVDIPTAPQESRATNPIIGCVGRLSTNKGQKELIEAFEAVVPSFPSASLWLIGKEEPSEPSFGAELREAVAKRKLTEAIRFMGELSDARSAIAKMSVLALPSHIEAFPLVLLEAMASRVPVVATAVGGVAELVEDGVTGVIVPVGEPAALARAIARLLGDPAHCSELVQTAYARVSERFSKEHMLSKIRAIYRDVHEGEN